jgi:hypothetical protein
VRVIVGCTTVLVEGTGAWTILRLADVTAAAVVEVEVAEVVDDVLVTEEVVDVPVDDVVVPVVEAVPVEDVPVALVDEELSVLEAVVAAATEVEVEDSVGMPAAPATTGGTTGWLSGKGERFFMRRFMFPWSRR